jgi:threonine aldolase
MYSNVSVKEYSSYFDTVYISLYKYLGAAGGAVLCGDKAVIDKMTHQVKNSRRYDVESWANAAMALSHLDGLEERA